MTLEALQAVGATILVATVVAVLLGVARLAMRELVELTWSTIKFLSAGIKHLLWWMLIGWWWRRWVAPMIF